ncbi:hypothetical protein RA267_27935, partial [Pseudomonas syringae pv. tagetis]|uniref:hypothetical protein n=1 Tax=Pseudomonas syringae group genomosp. 7 TaxID=251699 RepID=UPI00376FA4E3
FLWVGVVFVCLWGWWCWVLGWLGVWLVVLGCVVFVVWLGCGLWLCLGVCVVFWVGGWGGRGGVAVSGGFCGGFGGCGWGGVVGVCVGLGGGWGGGVFLLAHGE